MNYNYVEGTNRILFNRGWGEMAFIVSKIYEKLHEMQIKH
jgi:hypothetical protein